ncbi:hypothetical protein AB0K48_05155 [Nonomuraea sp. NPDC055795]
MTATRHLNQFPTPEAVTADRPATGPVFLTYRGHGYRLWNDRIVLDWTRTGCKHQHWGGLRRRACRFCHRPCLFIDVYDRPVHKVCLEQAITAKLLAQPEAHAA